MPDIKYMLIVATTVHVRLISIKVDEPTIGTNANMNR